MTNQQLENGCWQHNMINKKEEKQVNQMKMYQHERFGELPSIVFGGVEYFGASEAARALCFTDPYKAINNHVDAEDQSVYTVLTNGGKQNKKFINESGLYSLIFGASSQGNNREIQERAKKFKRWVTSDVLPSIRKHGLYATEELINNPDLFIEVLSQYKDEKEHGKMLQQRIEEDRPKINYYNAILKSRETLTTTQIAADYGMSAKRLNELLRKLKVQRKVNDQWILYRKHMNQGFTKSKTSRVTGDGSGRTVVTTQWTQKGRVFLYNLLAEQNIYPQIEIQLEDTL